MIKHTKKISVVDPDSLNPDTNLGPEFQVNPAPDPDTDPETPLNPDPQQ